MTRIYTAATINRSVEQVYEYVTTPGHWPEWHPSSLGVSGGTDHSLAVGELVTEHFLVAGRRGEVVWTVRERQAPRRWVIDGTITSAGGGGGTVAYTLSPRDGQTFFEREFTYPAPNALFALLDALLIRSRVRAESEEALRRLKRLLESGQAIA